MQKSIKAKLKDLRALNKLRSQSEYRAHTARQIETRAARNSASAKHSRREIFGETAKWALRIAGTSMIVLALSMTMYGAAARLISNNNNLTVVESWAILEFGDNVNQDKSGLRVPLRKIGAVPVAGLTRGRVLSQNKALLVVLGVITITASGLRFDSKHGLTMFP